MVSDAFFPFRDGIDTSNDIGISSIVQPGGSIRDDEVIEAANEHGMAMLFTGTGSSGTSEYMDWKQILAAGGMSGAIIAILMLLLLATGDIFFELFETAVLSRFYR